MSPTSYQTAPPRTSIIVNDIDVVKLPAPRHCDLHKALARIQTPVSFTGFAVSTFGLVDPADLLSGKDIPRILTRLPGIETVADLFIGPKI
jgi:hypothetical protein